MFKHRLQLAVLLIAGLAQGCWLTPPLTPVVRVTPVPGPPGCSWRDLGEFQSSLVTADHYLVLRSVADWEAYKAQAGTCWRDPATYPLTPTPDYPVNPPPALTLLDGFDFDAETVLVFRECSGSKTGVAIDSVCVTSTEIVVGARDWHGDAYSPYPRDYSHAYALPAVGLPVRVEQCTTVWSTSCKSIVLP